MRHLPALAGPRPEIQRIGAPSASARMRWPPSAGRTTWSGAMLGPGMAGGDAVESSFTDIAINSNAEEMASFRTCTETRNDQTLYAAHLY